MKINLTCPYCSGQAMTLARKMWLGPATSTACKNCGKKVSVPFSAMVEVVPFGAAILAAPFLGSISGAVVVVITGLAAMTAIHLYLVPVAPRS
jgi:DNA-directed RNA polymerase subunit RPC12/RpoP